MALFSQQLKPEDVFTPRAATVNQSMYIDRPQLERSIETSLRVKFHIIIHGESGTGKTWLYKNAFADKSVPLHIINMAQASRFSDLNKAFQEFINSTQKERKTGRSLEYSGELDTGIASGTMSRTTDFEPVEPEPFEKCLRMISSGNTPSILVLDNFERKLDNKKLIKQVVDVITLLDDENYSKYNVRLAIVGVPDDIQRFFSGVSRSTTVANRIREIPEVARMTPDQTRELILRGFTGRLRYKIAPAFSDELVSRIAWLTDQIPQQIHELCLEVALADEANKLIDSSLLGKASSNWAKTSLMSNYSVISDLMNARRTSIGRRNQTLFALGLHDGEDFTYNDIEQIIRREFVEDTGDVTLNIS
jgi:hypothetical protein